MGKHARGNGREHSGMDNDLIPEEVSEVEVAAAAVPGYGAPVTSATVDGLASPASSAAVPETVEVEAFEGKGPQKVNTRSFAPFGWNIAIILGLVAFIDKAEASIVGGVLESLKEEWGFSDAVGGLLLSAPIFASILLIIPAGILADTKRRKNILVAVLVVWSIFSLGSAAAPGLVVFFAFRVALGAAAPLNIPPTSSLVADYYPRKGRTKAFSIVRSAENTGQAFGVLAGALIIWATDGSWRTAFILMAIPGLILAFLVARIINEPIRGVGDKISAIGEGTASADSAVTPPRPVERIKLTTRVRQVFASSTVRKLVLGQAIVTAAFAGLFAFATSFFARFYFDDKDTLKNADGVEVTVPGGLTDALKDAGYTQYIDADAIGLAGVLGAGLSIPAILFGVWVVNQIDARYQSPSRPALRVIVATLSLLIGSVLLIGFAASSPIGLRFFFFLTFAAVIIIAVSNLGAATADVIPARLRGSGFAVLQMCMALGGAFGPALIGIGSAAAGDDLRYGFVLLVIPLLIGAAVLWTARKTYPADAEQVVREAVGGPPAAPMH
jgi:MFS family permease